MDKRDAGRAGDIGEPDQGICRLGSCGSIGAAMVRQLGRWRSRFAVQTEKSRPSGGQMTTSATSDQRNARPMTASSGVANSCLGISGSSEVSFAHANSSWIS